MPLSTQPYKGARDFYPEDKRLQKYMFKTIRQVVERFGYEEYDAPLLEPTELFASKTSDEIVNEQTYTFEDRGGRSVTVRTEMTPSVSRMVAGRRQELPYPLRWYSIPVLWRYERPQKGRLREFWQLNVDLFGVSGLEADHETILVAHDILKAFGATDEMFTIHVNSRGLINAYLHEILGLDETQTPTLMRLIDKMHKIEKAEFVGLAEAVFTPSQREAGQGHKLFDFLQARTLNELPEEIRSHAATRELTLLLDKLEASHVRNVRFDPTLMRGFDYYTDIVFEVFDTDPENNRAMFGGGRYDALIGLFGVEPVPSVGFAMGDATLQNFLEAHKLLPKIEAELDVYVILIGDVYDRAQPFLAELRKGGVKVAIDSTGRKPDKQTKAADKKGVHYVLFIGDKELAEERFTLKNLHTGAEERHGIDRLVTIIKDYRQK